MTIVAMLLCFSSCLSNGYYQVQVNSALQNPLIRNRALAVIDDYADFDFDFTFEEIDLKNQLLTFNEENDTLTSSELARMRMLCSNPTFNPGLGPLSLDPAYETDDGEVFYRPDLSIQYPEIDMNIVDESNGLRTYEYNEQNACISFNTYLNGSLFLGLYASPDACVMVYNVFALFMDTFSPLDILDMVDAFSQAAPIACECILSFLSGFVDDFFALFSSAVGVVVAAVITVLVVLALIYVAYMIYYGRRGRGFACGWFVDYRGFTWHYGAI